MNFKKTTLSTMGIISLISVGSMSYAEGDIDAGQKAFNKCKSCHMVVSPEGEEFVKGGKTGPNLYGVIGRAVASQEGFKYGKPILSLSDSDLVWTEEELANYITDPKAWLVEKTGDKKARSKMSFKLNKEQEDVAAYLATFSPVVEETVSTEEVSETK